GGPGVGQEATDLSPARRALADHGVETALVAGWRSDDHERAVIAKLEGEPGTVLHGDAWRWGGGGHARLDHRVAAPARLLQRVRVHRVDLGESVGCARNWGPHGCA